MTDNEIEAKQALLDKQTTEKDGKLIGDSQQMYGIATSGDFDSKVPF